MRVLAGAAGVVALVLAAAGCSNSPSGPTPRSGTTTTSGRLPPRNFPRGSTSTTAAGAGTGTYVGPNRKVAQGNHERAIVVASDVGTCGGVPAYQQVKSYYPEQGETLSNGPNSTINTCTGP